MSHRALPRSFFEADAATVARDLLGKIVKKDGCEGIIVETESYATDGASHAHKPMQGTLMRESYGYWYVYFTYGMHWCANVTCDKNGPGAVLIRAVEPTAGVSLMRKRRGTNDVRKLSTGPACFAQAFGIGKQENGLPLSNTFGIFEGQNIPEAAVGISPRIGIPLDAHLPLRFYIKGNPYVSKAT